MKNILLILKHEYLTRVSKKSFIIMTLLGPLLIAAFYGTIFLISFSQMSKTESKSVLVYDPYQSLNQKLPKTKKSYNFAFVTDSTYGKQEVAEDEHTLLLRINNSKGDSIDLISKKSISLTDRQELKEMLSEHYFNAKLTQKGLSSSMIDSMHQKIYLNDQLLSGKGSAIEIKSGIGYIGAFIIYLFIFMYGVMIMRGVTEEKNNRIVEIIVSAVKPFELMMGKILGVALVGLTQFLAWIILSGVLVSVLTIAIGAETINAQDVQQISQNIPKQDAASSMNEILGMFNFQSLNFTKIIVGFVVFFFGGFLLYSSLFAAIGSAVDSDTETQQFMFPVSMPLILGLVIAQIAVIKDPNSSLAVWCSMIPLTSPVVMMVRLPFDVSWGEIAISAGILFTSFVLIVWLAGKIYRIGILSYGQKASYKQLFKWIMSKS
ncbi:MAG: ABC transporter permease [Bacteroidetes bacterium]|nr:ABC transporter permease [Bacteroidota bacterium]